MQNTKEIMRILMVLVYTYCLVIFAAVIGVGLNKINAQFVEGLISGSLVGLITTLVHFVAGTTGGDNEKVNPGVTPAGGAPAGTSSPGADTKPPA